MENNKNNQFCDCGNVKHSPWCGKKKFVQFVWKSMKIQGLQKIVGRLAPSGHVVIFFTLPVCWPMVTH